MLDLKLGRRSEWSETLIVCACECERKGKWGNEVKRWSTNAPVKYMFALDKVFFMQNVYESHCICAVIFMDDNRIHYYYSIGSYGHVYTIGLMIYLKDEGVAKKGGELPDADKWNIVGAVDGVPQHQNGFDFGVFACMFADFIYRDRHLSFR